MRSTFLKAIFLVAILALGANNEAFSSEISLAGKGGYFWFNEHANSQYPDNHIMDNEWGIGSYIRAKKDRLFARLDYEQVKTGGEFQSFFGPYEGVKENLRYLFGSSGIFLNELVYAGAGVGVGFHTFDILTFAVHPVEEEHKTSFAAKVYLGAEKELWKNLFGFMECQYVYNEQAIKARVLEPGTFGKSNSFKLNEDLSFFSVWTGIGWKF